MAPDLDVLIRSSQDPLLAIEYHRHFTHSLAFVPIGALLCAFVLYPLLRRRLDFRWLYLFCALGYASHGLLDACTSYGTRLFWPFSAERVALNLVSVVDPLFTVPLIAAVVLYLWRRRLVCIGLGLAWCVAYLALGYWQQLHAIDAVHELAAGRGHQASRVLVKPSFANILLWKTIYEANGNYYIDAVRLGGAVQVFAGESVAALELSRDFSWLDQDSVQFGDYERFNAFSAGYLAVDPRVPDRLVDIRYSLVPNRADGFWAIELDAGAPLDQHAVYVTMRSRTMADGMELLNMVFH